MTEEEELACAYRTPSLRNVALRAPYMHAGGTALKVTGPCACGRRSTFRQWLRVIFPRRRVACRRSEWSAACSGDRGERHS